MWSGRHAAGRCGGGTRAVGSVPRRRGGPQPPACHCSRRPGARARARAAGHTHRGLRTATHSHGVVHQWHACVCHSDCYGDLPAAPRGILGVMKQPSRVIGRCHACARPQSVAAGRGAVQQGFLRRGARALKEHLLLAGAADGAAGGPAGGRARRQGRDVWVWCLRPEDFFFFWGGARRCCRRRCGWA